MRTFTFQKPVGTDAETDFVNRVLERVMNELQFYDTTTVKIERTTRGLRLHANIPPPSIPSSGGINFRGEYDPALAYAKNDLVVVSTGDDMGSYLCVTDNPGAANPPNQGNNFWVSLVPSLGQFL